MISFTAKNLAGDVFSLSCPMDIDPEVLRSLLSRTFQPPPDHRVIWFVEGTAFALPQEGQTLDVFFRSPYLLRLDAVDDVNDVEVNLLTLTRLEPWNESHILRWMKDIQRFRQSIEWGNPTPRYYPDTDWILYQHDTLVDDTASALDEPSTLRTGSMDTLIDIQHIGPDDKWHFPCTLRLRLTLGPETPFCLPLLPPIEEALQQAERLELQERILDILRQHHML